MNTDDKSPIIELTPENIKPFDLDSKETQRKLDEFNTELTTLINKLSLENMCNTPDFVISSYLVTSFINYCNTIDVMFNMVNNNEDDDDDEENNTEEDDDNSGDGYIDFDFD